MDMGETPAGPADDRATASKNKDLECRERTIVARPA
jgi:hypothetical protein